MKFNEKLIELRKKEGLSQEELGYKLNVTRQTVSKWELGLTTPEMDKLVEISKLFNVSVDQLIKESEYIESLNKTIEDEPIVETKNETKNNKVILVLVFVFIFVVVCIFTKLFMFNKVADIQKGILNKFNKETSETTEESKEILDKFYNSYDKTMNIIVNQIDSINEEKDSYNESDSTNIYDNMSSNSNKLVAALDNLESDLNNGISVSAFNEKIELFAGTASKLFAETLLDNIVTSNKKNNKKITVKYNKIETKDEKEIKNIKKKIHNMSDFSSFDISCEYDKDGYIYEVTIEKM